MGCLQELFNTIFEAEPATTNWCSLQKNLNYDRNWPTPGRILHTVARLIATHSGRNELWDNCPCFVQRSASPSNLQRNRLANSPTILAEFPNSWDYTDLSAIFWSLDKALNLHSSSVAQTGPSGYSQRNVTVVPLSTSDVQSPISSQPVIPDGTVDNAVSHDEAGSVKDDVYEIDDGASVSEYPVDYWHWDETNLKFYHIDEDGSRVECPDEFD